MNPKIIYFIRKGELLTNESLKISMESFSMIKKPLFVSSTLEEFNSLKKVNSFTMAFHQDICQKLHHILGLSLNNQKYPIYFMMQNILIRSKNANVFVKIEEKAKNTIEVGIFSVNSEEEDKSLYQFVEKYLYNHLIE